MDERKEVWLRAWEAKTQVKVSLHSSYSARDVEKFHVKTCEDFADSCLKAFDANFPEKDPPVKIDYSELEAVMHQWFFDNSGIEISVNIAVDLKKRLEKLKKDKP